jgi:hypothetical protein
VAIYKLHFGYWKSHFCKTIQTCTNTYSHMTCKCRCKESFFF